MITTVCPNPSIDRELHVNSFEAGGTNRVVKTVDKPGGKGINVAHALTDMGLESRLIGFMPVCGSDQVRQALQAWGIRTQFIDCDGALRANMKIIDAHLGQVTELNSSGPRVTDEQVRQLYDLAASCAQESDMLVLSGSIPPGAPADMYARMVRLCRDKTRCVVDADGEALRLAIGEHPYFIKPNQKELESAAGKRLNSRQDVAAAARSLISHGTRVVVVSMGKEGSMLVSEDEVYMASAPEVPVGTTVGAGDAMVAAVCAALMRDDTPADVLRHGAAAAAVAVSAGRDGSRYEALFESVELTRLEI
ncbi:MAG: 1-phosphofructokinase family hexose kinase [Christensenellales bacterium]|jgi:1-phosphofructokinase